MKYLVYLFCFLSLPAMAGEWKVYTSQIEGVTEPGYYNIELTPELMGLMGCSDFRHIRIYDKENREVPYFVRSDKDSMYTTLSPLPSIPFTVTDSTDRHTYIRFSGLSRSYLFNRVDFCIRQVGDYYRDCHYFPEGYTCTLSSQSDNLFYRDEAVLLLPDSYFRIRNLDNPPLQIEAIRFYCLNRYVCAFLMGGRALYAFYR
ncbi:MAG: hypothetical protein LIP01_01185 [Tannerellaceae bacterium]|nr:hypothetical protein [Tannerellaceae bacterium]